MIGFFISKPGKDTFKLAIPLYDDKVIANIGGSAPEDYVETAKRLSTHDMVGALELNISS